MNEARSNTGLSDGVKAEIQQGYRTFLQHNGLKPRLGQKQMIAAIANGLSNICDDDEGKRVSNNPVTVVEAGTGTGKTLAYLLAVLPLAKALDKRVVIATGTVALQEQLVSRDLPLLLESTEWDYQVALAKGRGRYLCPLKLQQCLDGVAAQHQGLHLFEDELIFSTHADAVANYQAMDKALQQGEWGGDRDSWPVHMDDVEWQPLTVGGRQCAGRRCRLIRECCFFTARDALEDADCIVANHDLVMSDLALGGGAILPAPEDTIYVFDEGHRLADTALQHFSHQCRIRGAVAWLSSMGKQCSNWQKFLQPVPEFLPRLEALIKAATDAERLLELAFPLLDKQLPDTDKSDADHLPKLNFTGGKQPEVLREHAGYLVSSLSVVVAELSQLSERFNQALNDSYFAIPKADVEPLFQQTGTWLSRIEAVLALWQSYAEVDDENRSPMARWIAYEHGSGQMDIRISSCPTDAGDICHNGLWARCYGAVITSATLRTLGDFGHFSKRLGLPQQSQCHTVPGAFDYANVATLTIPKTGVDMADGKAHTAAVIDLLPKLLANPDMSTNLAEGTLVLFASRWQMESVYSALPEQLLNQVIMQGQFSHAEIIQRHRSQIDDGESSIIFGLASFAEGVDFPGNYCSHVIIAKLPFSVPDDPVYQTLSDWYQTQGRNPFMELMLPEVSLRLHQACGRLIRSEQDTGRITILDERLISKRYGQQILNDLPPFRRVESH